MERAKNQNFFILVPPVEWLNLAKTGRKVKRAEGRRIDW
jgi:hypothetical protein